MEAEIKRGIFLPSKLKQQIKDLRKVLKAEKAELDKEKQIVETDKLDFKAYKSLMEDYWLPYVKEMLALDVEMALSKDNLALAAKARENIYNRLWGKPTEMIRQDAQLKIEISITEISSLTDPNNEVIEGEVMELLPPPEKEKEKEAEEDKEISIIIDKEELLVL